MASASPYWIEIDSTTAEYPSGKYGAKSTTQANSIFADPSDTTDPIGLVNVLAFVWTVIENDLNVAIREHDGTTDYFAFQAQVAADIGHSLTSQSFGNGILLQNGLSVRTAGALVQGILVFEPYGIAPAQLPQP